jgi:hypothetical protein
MRQGWWLLAGCLVLALGTSARAQIPGPLFFTGGVDPTQLVFVPLDTSNSVVPINGIPQSRPTGFRLMDLIPHFSFPGSKPVIGQSLFPTQSQLPGADYLRPFQFRGAPPIGR